MLTASVHTLSAALAAYAPLISIVASALTRLVSDLAVERQRPAAAWHVVYRRFIYRAI